MPDPVESIVGKPLTITLPDGEKRTVGTITAAKSVGDGIYVAATVTDEALKAQLAA